MTKEFELAENHQKYFDEVKPGRGVGTVSAYRLKYTTYELDCSDCYLVTKKYPGCPLEIGDRIFRAFRKDRYSPKTEDTFYYMGFYESAVYRLDEEYVKDFPEYFKKFEL